MGIISRLVGADKMQGVLQRVTSEITDQLDTGSEVGRSTITSAQLPATVRLDVFGEMVSEHLIQRGLVLVEVTGIPGSQMTFTATNGARKPRLAAEDTSTQPAYSEAEANAGKGSAALVPDATALQALLSPQLAVVAHNVQAIVVAKWEIDRRISLVMMLDHAGNVFNPSLPGDHYVGRADDTWMMKGPNAWELNPVGAFSPPNGVVLDASDDLVGRFNGDGMVASSRRSGEGLVRVAASNPWYDHHTGANDTREWIGRAAAALLLLS